MATLYITTNADSGAGSLRALLETAATGDVIQPSPDVFPSGAPCEIELNSGIKISKGVTISGAQTRIRFFSDATASRYFTVTAGIGTTVEFDDCDFVNLRSSYYGGAFQINGPDYVIFRRCFGVGNYGKYGGFAHVSNDVNPNTSLMLYDSAFYGNYATTQAAFIYFQGPVYQKAWFENCTYAANVCPSSNNPFSYTPPAARRVNVVDSTENWLVAPDANYSAETWTPDSWRSFNPRLIAQGDAASETDSFFDLDGNFRYEDVDENGDVSGGAKGAYEVMRADLYWIGLDHNGDEIIGDGSFELATGWATSPNATECGSVAPTDGQTLFIGKSVKFVDEPVSNATLVIGAHCSVTIAETNRVVSVTLGLGATLDSDDKNLTMEAPVIKTAKYSKLLAPVQQTSKYPMTSYTDGYIDDLSTLASNFVSCYPTYGSLRVLAVESDGDAFAISGVYNADTIYLLADGDKHYVAFGERLLPPVAAQPEFHCRVFLAKDILWDDEIQPVVYPREWATLDSDGLENAPIMDILINLSEANEGVELTLDGQRITKLTKAVSIVGSATIQNESFYPTLISTSYYAGITARNCSVLGGSIDVVDYSLIVDGGAFAPTTINISSSSSLFEVKLDLRNVSGLSTISFLTMNNAGLFIEGGAITLYNVTTVDATLCFDRCASVSYSGIISQASVTFRNVELASIGGFAVNRLNVYDARLTTSSAISATEASIARSDVSTTNVTSSTLNLEDESVLTATNVTAETLTAEKSTIAFSGVMKGANATSSATFTDCALNGGESSRISFPAQLSLNNTQATANQICSMTRSEYDAIETPSASAPFVLNGGSLTAGSLVVYETESYSFQGALAVESATIQGAAQFAENTVARFDAVTVANTGTITFTNGASVFEVGTLALNSSATINATTVAIDAMIYNVDTTINSSSATLGGLSPIGGARVIGAGGRFAFTTNEREVALSLDVDEVFSTGALRLAGGSTIKAGTIDVAGVVVTAGEVSFTYVEIGSFGAVSNSGSGELTILGGAITTTSINGAVVARGTTLSLGDVTLADGTTLEGASVAINKLRSSDQGCSTIVGTNSVTIADCLVAHNLTVDGGALSGALDCAATGSLHATGDHVKADIGSGVTLECDSVSCESITPKLAPSAITASAFINVDDIVQENNLTLDSPLITANSCVTHIGATLALSEFQTASFGDIAVYGEFSATGEDLTTTNLTVDGTFTATLTDEYNSLTINSQGATTVACATASMGALDIDGGTTRIIATNAATASDVDVAEGATLRVEPAPSALDSLLVAGTFQTAGPGAIQVADQVALSTVENVGSGRLELLLTVALDEEPTLIGDVIVRVINGTASDFLATATGANSVRFTFKAANEVPCTIEVQNGNEYDVITRSATPLYENGEYVATIEYGLANVNGKTFRLYDGAKYLTDMAITASAPSFYICTEKKAFITSRFGSAFFAARIIDQLTGELLTPNDVDEVLVTLYKINRTSASSYKRVSVANWINVSIKPQIFNEFYSVKKFDDEYNFVWVPDQSTYLLTNKQGSFALLTKIKLTNGRNPVVVTFEFDVK